MPSVPIPSSSPQLGSASSSSGPNEINQIQTLGPSSTPAVTHIQASTHDSTLPSHLEPSPVIPNQSNTMGGGTSYRSNIIGDQVECSSTNQQRTPVTISPTGVGPSGTCSDYIYSFKHEFDPRGSNWKILSNEKKDFLF